MLRSGVFDLLARVVIMVSLNMLLVEVIEAYNWTPVSIYTGPELDMLFPTLINQVLWLSESTLCMTEGEGI